MRYGWRAWTCSKWTKDDHRSALICDILKRRCNTYLINELSAGGQYHKVSQRNCDVNVAARTINCTDAVILVIENA